MKDNRMDFLKANYHAHTWRCQHAYDTEREYIEAAIAMGIEIFGFSDHVPCPYTDGYVSGISARLGSAVPAALATSAVSCHPSQATYMP